MHVIAEAQRPYHAYTLRIMSREARAALQTVMCHELRGVSTLILGQLFEGRRMHGRMRLKGGVLAHPRGVKRLRVYPGPPPLSGIHHASVRVDARITRAVGSDTTYIYGFILYPSVPCW
jgi:hypothetical protein